MTVIIHLLITAMLLGFATFYTAGMVALSVYVGLLLLWLYVGTYGPIERVGTIGSTYWRFKFTDSPYFVVDRHGSKRTQWVELGTVKRKGHPVLYTVTVGNFTAQVGKLKGPEADMEGGESDLFEYRVNGKKQLLTPEQLADAERYFESAFGYMDKAHSEIAKIYKRHQK